MKSLTNRWTNLKVSRLFFYFALSIISIFLYESPIQAQGLAEHGVVNSLSGTMGSTTTTSKNSTVKSLSKIYNNGLNVSGTHSNASSGSSIRAHCAANSIHSIQSNYASKNGQKFSDSEIQTATGESNKLYSLAQQKEKSGKLEEAKQIYYKAALARVHIWGTGDPAVAKISLQIGQIEYKQKHIEEARIWFKRSLTALSKHYGPGDYELVPALTQLAKLESATNNHEVASSYYQHILSLQERKFGEENEKCMPIRILLTQEYLAAKNLDEAKDTLNKAMTIEKKIGAITSPEYNKLTELSTQIEAVGTSGGSK